MQRKESKRLVVVRRMMPKHLRVKVALVLVKQHQQQHLKRNSFFYCLDFFTIYIVTLKLEYLDCFFCYYKEIML